MDLHQQRPSVRIHHYVTHATVDLLHMSIFEQEALIFLEVLPTDVAWMMIVDERRPFFSRLLVATDLERPSIAHVGALAHPPEPIGTGVERIVKDLHHAMIGGRYPLHFADVADSAHHRHLDAGYPKPEEHLARAAKLSELGRHESYCFLDMLVNSALNSSF